MIELFPIGEPEIVSIWQDNSVAYRIVTKAPLRVESQTIKYRSQCQSPIPEREEEDTPHSSPSYSPPKFECNYSPVLQPSYSPPKVEFNPHNPVLQSTSAVDPMEERRKTATGRNIDGKIFPKSSDEERGKP